MASASKIYQKAQEAFDKMQDALANNDESEAQKYRDITQKLVGLYEQQKEIEAKRRGSTKEAAYSAGAGALRGAGELVEFGSGIAEFLQTGMADKVSDLLPSLTGAIGGSKPMQAVSDVVADLPVSKEAGDPRTMPRMISDVTGGYSAYKSPTTLGQYAGTGGEFVGGAGIMPIGGMLRSMGQSVLPSIASETAGQVAQKYAPEYEDAARFVGALGSPVVTEGLKAGTRKMLSGDTRMGLEGSERARSVATLDEAGVPLTTGQKVGSEKLMRLEGVEAADISTLEGISKQVMMLMGSDAPKATRSALKERKDSLGEVFDRAEAVADDVATQGDIDALNGVISRFEDAASDATIPKAVSELLKRFESGKQISGEALANFRKRFSNVIETSKGDERAAAALGAKEILDDIIQRSVQAQDPKLFDQLVQARQQYRTYLTAMRAINRQGETFRSGIISPKALSNAARLREGQKYLTGEGSPLADLAFAAEEIASSLPTTMEGSGRYLKGLGTVGGGLLASQLGDAGVAEMLTGAALGYAVPKATQAGIRSGPVQRGLMPPEYALQARLLERLAGQTGGLLNID